MKYSLLVILLFVLSETAHAALPPPFRPGRNRFSLESEYFTTTGNYDEYGEQTDLPGANKFDAFINRFDGTMYLQGGWAVGAGFGLTYATSEDAVDSRTNSEFNDIHFNGQKLLSFGQFRLIPEAEVLLSLIEVDRTSVPLNNDEVITSDAAHTARVGSWASLAVSGMRLYGYGGYQYRSDGRSSLAHWLAGLEWRPRTFSLSGELYGFESVKDDEFEGTLAVNRIAVTDHVNATSKRFYSVNPQLVAAKIEFSHTLNPTMTWKIGYGQTLSGENYSEGRSIFAGFAFNMDPPTATSRERVKETSKTSKDEFKPDLEDVPYDAENTDDPNY